MTHAAANAARPGPGAPAAAAVDFVRDVRRASALLHPLRLRIVEALREPGSATSLARRLGLPRQKVNYHVRELARAGYLRRAGQRRRRNMIERWYVATARAWVLSPELLGGVGIDRGAVEDAFSAAYLAALTSQVQRDLARVSEAARKAGKRLSTLSISSKLRFESAEQRAAFTRALRDALVDLVGRHASPYTRDDGSPAPGRPYHLVLGVYPMPPEEKGAPADAGRRAQSTVEDTDEGAS